MKNVNLYVIITLGGTRISILGIHLSLVIVVSCHTMTNIQTVNYMVSCLHI